MRTLIDEMHRMAHPDQMAHDAGHGSRAEARRQLTVADAMVTHPAIHGPSTTVAQLRALFGDDHVHMALLVDGGRLVGTVERADLAAGHSSERLAAVAATLEGRTVGPHAGLSETFNAMKRAGRRRLAVVDNDLTLLGLLCAKASGHGFCSDADVVSRRCASDSR